jgi:polyhydroxyalkanoate synthesis regulator phasin
MKDTLERIITLGLGTIAVTKEKAEQVAKELMKEGQVNRKEADAVVKKLMKRGQESRKELDAAVEKTIHGVMKKLDIPTRSEVDKLRAEIASLKKARGAKRR